MAKENVPQQFVKTFVSKQSISALEQELDKNGDPFLPRYTATMTLTLPVPISGQDADAVREAFVEGLSRILTENRIDEPSIYETRGFIKL